MRSNSKLHFVAIYGSLTLAVFSYSFCALSQEADKSLDFPFDRYSLSQMMDKFSRDNGIRAYLVSPHRCEQAGTSTDTDFFCEYSFMTMRVRVWSEKNGDPLKRISARSTSSSNYATLALAYAALISVIDPDLTDDVVAAMSDKLISVGRTISGRTQIVGNNAIYLSNISRDELHFSAFPHRKPPSQ